MMFPARNLIFSFNTFVAAMLALYIAFALDLPRPFWAMLTVYITAQPLTGALRSKAVYRVIGTILGGAAAVVLVPSFVTAPLLLSLIIASWTGFCLYLSLLDRTPRAYVFMLAGYTTAIIGFPSVNAPQAIFETALARVEEISLGIICATLVHTLFLPRDVAQALNEKIDRLLADGQAWIAQALTKGADVSAKFDRRRLAKDATDLHLVSTHLPFDTANLPLRRDRVRLLNARFSYILPLITALEDRLKELQTPPPDLAALVADISAWVGRDELKGAAEFAGATRLGDTLLNRCRALRVDTVRQACTWDMLLSLSILVRLEDLIDAVQDSRDVAAALRQTGGVLPPRLKSLATGRRTLHLDHGMAALSGLALTAAVMACCLIWIFTAWPEGATAAVMASVFASFFAAQDDPAPAIIGFLVWSVLAMPLAALYLFAILPAIDGFPMLTMALAPALLLVGGLQASPKWGPRGIALAIGFAGALSLQETFSADMPNFLNGNLAQICGVAMALIMTRLLRSVGAGWAARRVLNRGRRAVLDLAQRPGAMTPDRWIGAMLDRVDLINMRAGFAEPMAGAEDEVGDFGDLALADLRIGLNLLDLKRAADRVSPASTRAIHAVQTHVAHLYERRLTESDVAALKSSSAPPDEATNLLAAIDKAISRIAVSPPDDGARGLAALTGLRRNLFSQAPPYAGIAEPAA
jgi:uncharacterized membrane protein YccC